jgi:hypothetical protein
VLNPYGSFKILKITFVRPPMSSPGSPTKETLKKNNIKNIKHIEKINYLIKVHRIVS